MNVLVIGSGRVGSTVARELQAEGWSVTVVDEKDESLGRLGENWPGTFIVGHGMDTNVLLEAGIEEADAVVVATNGDNTNLVIGQVAQRRFGIECVVVRILDPARAKFYSDQGMRIICPTQTAIDELTDAVSRSKAAPAEAVR